MNHSFAPKIYCFTPGLRRQRGLTLIELMVSITIGLILLAGLTALIAQQSSTQAELEKSSRQIENGRYAIQLLNEEVQMAGYYGEFSNVAGLPVPAALPNPCAVVAADIDAAMVFPVQGYDSPATTTGLLSCINTANHVSGTDILVIRRADVATLTIAGAASAAGGQVYLQSGLTPAGSDFTKAIGTGASTTGFTLLTQAKQPIAAASGVAATPAIPAGPAPLRRFQTHIYFVSPCSVMSNGSTCQASDDGGKPIPTLKRVELTAAGNTTTTITTPLVEGIENMQVNYGIDSIGNDGSFDGQLLSTPPTVAPATVADWGNVVAVRVHLLARNNESTAGYQDPKTYEMGFNSAGNLQTVTPVSAVQAYKRRLFSQLIRVVNTSSRRDQ